MSTEDFDPEYAEYLVRKANNETFFAQQKVEAFENVFAAFDELRRTGYVPQAYTPQWRARTERAEAAILDTLGYIDRGLDSGEGGTYAWRNDEVMEMLREIRTMLAPIPKENPDV